MPAARIPARADLHHLSATALLALLRQRQCSAVEAAQHFLARAQSTALQSLGAYLAINEEVTLAQARAADALLDNNAGGPLTGLPIAHKDIFVTRDFPSTAASRMLAGYRSPFDATVVANLAAAGCVTLGKLNCDEFAMGSGNENGAIAAVGLDAPAPVRNPWNPQHVPGGSSGGSAVAVAAALAAAATGSDTGGSIRQPAAFCGITGIKPTYGRASRYGMIAFASSLDQAGILAKNAQDCALLLSALCGPDTLHDATSLDIPAEDFTKNINNSEQRLRIGIPEEFFSENIANDARQAIDTALKEYEKRGATLVPVALPRSALAIPVYYILAPAEASSNLARFDGVRYGHRASDCADLLDMYQKTRAQGFGAEVKRRILTGTYVLSAGYYDAYYLQAQKVRRLIAEDFQHAFARCDIIAAPVAPAAAWKIGANTTPLQNYLADIYTLPASLAGLPCMSVPVGFDANGLPLGMQLIGNYFQESRLLAAAHQYQQASDFHLRQPPPALLQ